MPLSLTARQGGTFQNKSCCVFPAVSASFPTPPIARILGSKEPLVAPAEGRRKVEPSPPLMEAAQDLAKFMASMDQYGHIAGGGHPAARVKQHGYNYCIISENIACRHRSPGCTTERIGHYYAMQMFGRLRAGTDERVSDHQPHECASPVCDWQPDVPAVIAFDAHASAVPSGKDNVSMAGESGANHSTTSARGSLHGCAGSFWAIHVTEGLTV